MKKHTIVLSGLFLLFCAFRTVGGMFAVPDYFPAPVYDFSKKRLNEAEIELGRALFYDPVLSRDSTVSCASCHSPYNGFAHADHALSHGIDNIMGTRNAPALMNLAWQPVFMWDGAVNHLDVQPLAPISNQKEMGENIAHVVTKLQRSALYPALFRKAFGDTAVTGERILLAIAQFQLTFISCESKYDSVMQHKASFTAQEQHGYELFKGLCASCHKEPLFSTYEFKNNGLPVDTTLNDYGKYMISHDPNDSLLFKVPTLRNIEYSFPYMHDGRFRRLSEVMNFYASPKAQGKTLAPELREPLKLAPNDKVDLVAFLLTLSDRKFIFNPQFAYPKEIFSPQPKETGK